MSRHEPVYLISPRSTCSIAFTLYLSRICLTDADQEIKECDGVARSKIAVRVYAFPHIPEIMERQTEQAVTG